jgi:hypothetical protein
MIKNTGDSRIYNSSDRPNRNITDSNISEGSSLEGTRIGTPTIAWTNLDQRE